MNTLWYQSYHRALYQKQQEIIDIGHSIDNLWKNGKIRKWLRKGSLEKDWTFFSIERKLQNTLNHN